MDTQISAADRLLRVADPDGYFKEGSALGEAAKARGIKALEVDKARREAAEKQRQERLVCPPIIVTISPWMYKVFLCESIYVHCCYHNRVMLSSFVVDWKLPSAVYQKHVITIWWHHFYCVFISSIFVIVTSQIMTKSRATAHSVAVLKHAYMSYHVCVHAFAHYTGGEGQGAGSSTLHCTRDGGRRRACGPARRRPGL